MDINECIEEHKEDAQKTAPRSHGETDGYIILAYKWIKQSKLEYQAAKDVNATFRTDLLRERAYMLESCAREILEISPK